MLENLVLKEQIGQTATTETWFAFERLKKKRLILKRLQRSAFEPNGGERRFAEDAALWESLNLKTPSCLLPVFAWGTDDDWLWFAQEVLVENGKSLAELLQSGKSPRPFDVARKFVDLCASLAELHDAKLLHRNVQPKNIYFVGADGILLLEPDIGHFLDPEACGPSYNPEIDGPSDYLAPEQRHPQGKVDARTDVWSVAACLFTALTGLVPNPTNLEDSKFDRLGNDIRNLLAKALHDNPDNRFPTMERFREAVQQISKLLRGSLFTKSATPIDPAFETVLSATVPPPSPQATPMPSTQIKLATENKSTTVQTTVQTMDVRCPQCGQFVVVNSRYCPHCNRAYDEPCLICQTPNTFWAKNCQHCNSDLIATKLAMHERLLSQQQQVMKLRENYGHDKALPLLKQMTLLTHPEFTAIRDWAKNLFPIIQKERKEIRLEVENIRIHAKAAFDEQKYEKVQEILSRVPDALVTDEMRKLYREAEECLTEVASLFREIRNSILTKQHNTLLSCVQRYLELKANDPEAKSLQEKIETLTTVTSKAGIKLRRIPSGKFYMGSHDSDEYLRNNERPQHRVTLTQPFLVAGYLITQKVFQRIMDYNPSISSDDPSCPVDNVTWFTALEFCNKLSDKDGLSPYYELLNIKRRSSSNSIESADVVVLGGEGYRLLTEAEWEYSCRAGSITPWYCGDLAVEVTHCAWYFDNSPSGTQPVGLKKPNSWGLYDMHGNVMEWCFDWYNELYYQQCGEVENPTGPETGTAKTVRGGSWQFGPEAARSACRNSNNPEGSSNMIGFRIARNVVEEIE
ncbi:MAG: SUMF1/EgtB/PvdO family nonheme iron enzyme [Planctomycetaceae bacterium]|nr:SUMF1/EgtB/PvdO family nonheme iron enzyme [Planctomycetaceae bacterium]